MLVPSVVVLVAIVCAAGLLLWRSARRSRGLTGDPLEWLDEFSAGEYRPMGRLLDDHDRAFLASQNGFSPSIARRLRRKRVGIFQSYLFGMVRDFHRLQGAARVAAVYSRKDQGPFEPTLRQLRWRFYRSVVAMEFGLALNLLGIAAVDVRRLLASLEKMHLYMETHIAAVS